MPFPNSSSTRPWRSIPEPDEEGNGLLPRSGTTHTDRFPDKQRGGFQTRRPRWWGSRSEPRRHVITPIWPNLQNWPVNLFDRIVPRLPWKIVITVVFFLSWSAAFLTPLIRAHAPFQDPDEELVRNLNCDDTLWSPGTCGINGELCRPFTNSRFSFRCPAGCARTVTEEVHHVGPLDVIDQSLVVGSNPFRADSYICSAAIMASVVTDSRGGCGRVTRVGKHDVYVGQEWNGVQSVGFDSYFPFSFTVSPDPELPSERYDDPRGLLLSVSLGFTAVFDIFTTRAAYLYFASFVAAFLHVGLVSDPTPITPFAPSVLPDRISRLAQALFPALFVATVVYRVCIRRTLGGLTAQVEKALLWGGGLWIGALANYTFNWVPAMKIETDITHVSKDTLVLAGLVAVAGTVALWQLYCLWGEGRLANHLLFYSTVGVLLVAVPWLLGDSVELQLHHYFIALVLLPATAMQTRTSLLIQGLLLGLLIHGLAHTGFSPLFIPANLPSSSIPHPSVADPAIHFTPTGANISFSFAPPTRASPLLPFPDGISVLVNDVERARLVFADVGRTDEFFTWGWPEDVKYDEFFRYGYFKDGVVWGYGPADTWFGNGSFWDAERGVFVEPTGL